MSEHTSPQAAPLLSIQNLSVSFETDQRDAARIQAVDNVSFDVLPGEVLGLVGESGSGKTVTGMSMLRLVPSPPGRYDSGAILFDVKNILDMTRDELRQLRGTKISAIFQEPMTALSPLMTVEKQLTELLDIHRPEMTKQDKREKVIEWLDKVGIPDPELRMKAYPYQYSGGMRQRVMIAMALMLEPRLVIADEPTTALDVTLQAQVFELMMRMKSESTSLVFITHDMGVVWELCDRVVVMEKAKVVEIGTVQKLFSAPEHPYTQKLLSAVPPLTDPQEREPLPAPPSVVPVVETRELSTWFPVKGFLGRTVDHVKAVNEVSMKIYPGQTVGLVGESGSGKSTLGRTLLGLEQPRSGSVHFCGAEEHVFTADLRRQFQMVFQDPYSSLNPRMPILDILTEAPRVHGMISARDEAFAAKCLEEVGLHADMLHRYPHEFSGGQRQRICIARALALEPDLIICDEAVSALDVTIQAQILDLLLELREKRNLAYLFISHDLSVVKRICDYVLVMRHGELVEQGTPDEVIHNPQQAYTKKLLDAVPIPGDESRRHRRQGKA